MNTKNALLLIVLIVIGLGCQDLTTAPESAVEIRNKNNVSSERIDTEIKDLEVVPRYSLDLEVKGNIELGTPVQIITRAKVNLPTRGQTELKLGMPEITAMTNAIDKHGNASKIEIAIGKPLHAKLEKASNLDKGQSIQKKANVTINEAGYYSIYAIVKTDENDENLLIDGKPVKNSVFKQLWLWIGKNGLVRITGEFDPDLFPENYRTQPGPLTLISEENRLSYKFSGENINAKTGANTTASSSTITVVATYVHPVTGAIVPLPGAKADIILIDEFSGQEVGGGSSVTDSQGRVDIGCSSSQGFSYRVEIFTENSDVDIHDDLLAFPSNKTATTRGDYSDCGDTDGARGRTSISHVFAVASPVVENSQSFFQKSRGPNEFRITPNGSNSFYSRAKDKIYIVDNNEVSHIGGASGDFVVAHEYGHAFHEKGLGGNEGGNCPSPHYLDGAHNLTCAFSEGFADYHAVVTVNNVFRSAIESNFYYPATRGDGDRNDGSIIEGAVAAFLFDITDGSNEAHDTIDLPGQYVADIYETCEVFNSNWRRANGIDHLIACFESRLPDYTQFFKSRTPTPTNFRESATEPSGWNQAAINQLWRTNLYGFN